MAIWDRGKEKKGTKWDKWIGGRIRQGREDKSWTQSELANEVHVSQPRISDYERGEVEIGVAELGYIALALEKPIAYFIPPKFNGATPDDLTDLQKEIFIYADKASDEMQLALLEQAKTYARICENLRYQEHREEMAIVQEEREGIDLDDPETIPKSNERIDKRIDELKANRKKNAKK